MEASLLNCQPPPSERIKFMTSVMSVIDFVAIMPYYIGLGLDDDNEVDGGCRSAVLKKSESFTKSCNSFMIYLD